MTGASSRTIAPAMSTSLPRPGTRLLLVTPKVPPPSNSTKRSPAAPTRGTASTSPPPSGKLPPSPPPPPKTLAYSSRLSSKSLVTSILAGIMVGVVLFLVLLCFFIVRKKRRRQPQLDYCEDPPNTSPGKDSPDGGYMQNVRHNIPPLADHVVETLPEPPLLAFARHMLYFPSPTQSPPPRPPISSSGGSGSTVSSAGNPLPQPSLGIALGFSTISFTYEELLMITNGFSDANLLGEGGFGYVHRGTLPDGKEVAVKQLKWGSGQGEREFQAEVEIISRVHHKHLVSLVGYCISEDRRLLLVYEFVPNNTLEFHLHGKGQPIMEWSTRLKIALGAAKGLAYLHEDCHPKIIHRDIKAANILLDFEFEVKVADFGLAKIASDNNTHISTRIMGTFGYMAPEYAASGKVTEKSDVFSFGIMLLELITGHSPVDSTQTFLDDGLVNWARPLLGRALDDGNFDALVDPRLQNNYNTSEMAHMIATAASCVRHSSRRRPQMSQVVRALEGDVSFDDLNDGLKPGHNFLYSSYGNSDFDSTKYTEDMKRFKKLALTSEDSATSEYSALASDNGRIPSLSGSEAHTLEMEMGRMKKDSRRFGELHQI